MEPYIDYEEKSSVAWFALGGFVIGAVAGLLYAPKGGKETRADIDQLAQRGRRRAQSWLNKVGDALPSRVKVAAGVGAVRGGMEEAFDTSKDKIEDFVNR